MGKAPPFARIAVISPAGERTLVLVNGRRVAEFEDGRAAHAFAKELEEERTQAERQAWIKSPFRYEQLRYAAELRQVFGLEGDPEYESSVAVGARVQELRASLRNSESGKSPKPPRRSNLRQAVIEAMKPLRAEEMTFHRAMLSLTHSPAGALRVRKEGNCWRCENEDEDWPPELLSREQLQALFKAAR